MPRNNLTFQKILEEGRNNSTLSNRIRVMKHDAADNWLRSLGKNDFIHSKHIEDNLNQLVPNNIKNSFDPAEIFVLLYAVYLHDIGRIQNESSHERGSYDEIIANYNRYKLNDRYEAKAVALVCYGHASEKECPLNNIDDNFGVQILGNKTLNLRFLAALFRLADEIDNAYTRRS